MQNMENLDRASPEAAITRRKSLKARSGFNNQSIWKHKLRESCYRRVREDRGRLLWTMRLPDSEPCASQEFIKSAFRDIVSDELKKMKSSSVTETLKNVHGTHEPNDMLWEYDGLHNAYQGDCEEILLEMQRIFYEDLDLEQTRKEKETCVDTWEDEEDELLARAVFEHMQLHEDEVSKRIWCPICKQGELQENHRLIYCNLCKLKLNKGSEVNLDLLRFRLAEAHSEHLDRGMNLNFHRFVDSNHHIPGVEFKVNSTKCVSKCRNLILYSGYASTCFKKRSQPLVHIVGTIEESRIVDEFAESDS